MNDSLNDDKDLSNLCINFDPYRFKIVEDEVSNNKKNII